MNIPVRNVVVGEPGGLEVLPKLLVLLSVGGRGERVHFRYLKLAIGDALGFDFAWLNDGKDIQNTPFTNEFANDFSIQMDFFGQVLSDGLLEVKQTPDEFG